MSQPLPQTIGIDIAKVTLDAHAHPAARNRQFANTATGHKALLAWLAPWRVERIAFEATGTYGRALEQALASLPCVKLNPERVRRFAQATGTLAKTDRIDAALLARMAATLQPPIHPVKSAAQAQLAELANARDGLIRDRTALKNREKTLTIPLLKRQCTRRLEQITRHLEALDDAIAAIIAADPPSPAGIKSLPASMVSARSLLTSSSPLCLSSDRSPINKPRA